MIDLFLVILVLLAVSFLCSLLESVILSLSLPYIQLLIDKKKPSGRFLKKMKDNIDEPIAAILTLNTIAHTMGAAISGVLAAEIFGSHRMGVFSAVLTFLILVFSEIIPKTIGARFWRNLSPVSAYVLKIMIIVLKPVILPMKYLSRLLTGAGEDVYVSKAEVYHFAQMGYRQGALEESEFGIIKNLFHLRNVVVRDIMTPRTVVESLHPEEMLGKVSKKAARLRFSRLPLYDSLKNRVTGIVLRRDIMNRIAEKKLTAVVKILAVKPHFVPETMSVLKLLTTMVKNRIHMAVVLNEFGDYVGIVTLEDAIESLLGAEIVDEFDPAIDMRELALKKGNRNKRIK